MKTFLKKYVIVYFQETPAVAQRPVELPFLGEEKYPVNKLFSSPQQSLGNWSENQLPTVMANADFTKWLM